MLEENQLYKILVVEDNLGDYVLVEEYINNNFLKLKIDNARNYKEFVEITNTNRDYDIIFLDLTLPDKNGIDLIIACTQLIDLVPIVVLTGYPDFNFAVQSLSLGVSDYLLKEDLNPTTLHKCIIYNIERYKNISKIKESEQYYLDLFQLSPNPLLVYDEKNLKILEVNNSAIENYQYSLNEFLTMNIEGLKVEKSRSLEVDTNLISINNDPKFILNDIECHQKKNGELMYVTSSKNKIIYKGIESIILSVEDLTNEINQILSIQLQNTKLREIAWIQSHVVRAPVSRIMGLANLLLDDLCDEEEQKSFCKMIMESSVELDDIIRDIVNKTKEV